MKRYCLYRQHLTRVTLLIALALMGNHSILAKEIQGETLYHDFGCVYCHGFHGQGGDAGGPRALAPSPYSLEAFGTFVRTPQNRMPAYTRQHLSDDQLSEIYQFVQDIKKPKDIKDISPLKDLQDRYRKVE
jgi:mono/diheme cytochrome c family protein